MKILNELNTKFSGTDTSAMALAYNIARDYSTCRLASIGKGVGSIITTDNRIISYGYNGVLDGLPLCTKDSCIRLTMNIPHGERRELCYGDCAEKRAIINAVKFKADLTGATLYSTKSPCVSCAKLIINFGIKRVVYDEIYPHADFSFELFEMAKVLCEQLSIV